MQHNCAYIYMYTSMLISGRREETYSHQFISSGRMELTLKKREKKIKLENLLLLEMYF